MAVNPLGSHVPQKSLSLLHWEGLPNVLRYGSRLSITSRQRPVVAAGFSTSPELVRAQIQEAANVARTLLVPEVRPRSG